MDLNESNLNRFLYKNNPSPVNYDPIYMSADINSSKNENAKSQTPGKDDAKNIITGTVITSCLIKSSDDGTRIEIGQNLQSVKAINGSDFMSPQSLDYLAAYENGEATFILTGRGISFFGYAQQIQKWMYTIGGSGLTYYQSGGFTWTVTHLGPGRYQINHNLGSHLYVAAPTPLLNAPYALATISDRSNNNFIVNTFSYGSATDMDWSLIVNFS